MSVTRVQLVSNVSTGASFAGIVTAATFRVGTAVTINSSGINVSGVITATSFSGNGANLTGVGLGTTGSINTSGIITATSIVVSAGTAAAPSISPTGDSNTGIFFPSADTIAFGEGGAEAMRVDSSGRLLIGISTSGNANGGPLQLSGGITFPATAVAASDANTLDDYEEGSWTPVVSFGGASVGITGAFNGTYTKVGNVVTIAYQLTFTSKGTSTGLMLVSGMPFAGSIDAITGFGFIHRLGTLVAAGQLYLQVDGTTFYPRFAGYNAGNTTFLTNTDISDTTDLCGGIVFRV